MKLDYPYLVQKRYINYIINIIYILQNYLIIYFIYFYWVKAANSKFLVSIDKNISARKKKPFLPTYYAFVQWVIAITHSRNVYYILFIIIRPICNTHLA